MSNRFERTRVQRAQKSFLWYFLILSLFAAAAWPGDVSRADGEDTDLTHKVWLPAVSRGTDPVVNGPGLPPIVMLSGSDWTQEAGGPQHTGYTSLEPREPWTLLWTWNGPDANGGAGGHFYNAPRDARTVTGGSSVYVPAGSTGLFALLKTNGQQAWKITEAAFNATPAYDPDTDYLYAGGANGLLYKINASTGAVAQTYQAGSPLNKAVMLVGSHAYVVTDSGQLHKVNTANMARAWVYTSGSTVATPPAYSARGIVVFATDDLYIHAVNDANGAQNWRVKPTVNKAVSPYTFEGFWPVIAEKHGIVFFRLNLGMGGLWSGPGAGGMYPSSNAETRAYLNSHPNLKNLFALDLTDGRESFIPAVGFGGVESLVNGSPQLDVGPMPVVRVLPDGKEVAYIHFRSGQGNPPDGRWDSHMGEMVLDGNTVPGLAAGDLRFIDFKNSYTHVSDEQTPLTMAGNILFHSHWGATESARILDRSNSRGLNHESPITSEPLKTVVRRQMACSSFDPKSHYTSCGLTLYDDGRYWSGPGYWVFWNVLDPPTPSRPAYSEGLLPRYAYVSGSLLIIEGNGGDLFVLAHWGGQ